MVSSKHIISLMICQALEVFLTCNKNSCLLATFKLFHRFMGTALVLQYFSKHIFVVY